VRVARGATERVAQGTAARGPTQCAVRAAAGCAAHCEERARVLRPVAQVAPPRGHGRSVPLDDLAQIVCYASYVSRLLVSRSKMGTARSGVGLQHTFLRQARQVHQLVRAPGQSPLGPFSFGAVSYASRKKVWRSYRISQSDLIPDHCMCRIRYDS